SARLSRTLFPEHRRHDLDSLVARHGLQVARRHRALDDARAVWDWLDRAVRPLPGSRVGEALDRLDARPLLPERLDPALMENLPSEPGVYRFYDAAGALLYVGQSGDLRRRVGDHFRPGAAGGRGARMVARVADVRWETTRGVLEAKLRESSLIKTLRPVHNRRLRRSRELCSWSWTASPGAYRPPSLVTLDGRVPGEGDGEHWGLFRTRRRARETLRELARARGLCPRRLGLERGRGACFGSQLGHCAGVCRGREREEQHDLRLLEGFAGLRRFVWPHAGAVGLRERDANGRVVTVHVIDRWRWLGPLDELDLPLPRGLAETQPLDLDHYRLLTAALRAARPGDLVALERTRASG
ncbi:MAG: GIY-YIG nuclease family protein, partial [Gammaproteobacteria bacterium]|nr:GIY-YIG nuclease family protein [Gammaproteobacteria bacterium]